jgi:hypothetical protein
MGHGVSYTCCVEILKRNKNYLNMNFKLPLVRIYPGRGLDPTGSLLRSSLPPLEERCYLANQLPAPA